MESSFSFLREAAEFDEAGLRIKLKTKRVSTNRCKLVVRRNEKAHP